MTCLLVSVLPAPDSPETTMHWLPLDFFIATYPFSAIAYTCGPHSACQIFLPRHCAITSVP